MEEIEFKGLKFQFDKEAIFDVEVADYLYDLSSGKSIPPMKKLLMECFPGQYKTIADALKGENGRFSIETASELFAAAIEQANAKKS